MAWLSRNDFTGSDYVQASDLNNLHDDIVTWGGNVNGGGYTLSNVVLAGVTTQGGTAGVTSFNTRTGAVLPQSGDYTAAMVGAVPTTVQVIAGSGMTGGGALTGNVTLNAQMLSFNTRVGAITLTPADITGAMGVVQARKINTGAGLQGGGNLSADLTLSLTPGDPTQQIQFLQAGAVVATRHSVNFISGANVTVAVTDNSTAGRVDVTVSSTGGGSGMVDPTTTKGDIIVRGPSITSRLAVGTDGQVLTADSTQSLGVRWGAASGGGAVTTVFGRTGAVVAGIGDYTAAQVTNAVDRSQTYSDPMWLTGLNWSKILAAPAFLMDPTTTKGDLIVHGAALSRLPVGADGSALVADSTQALGVRWGATAASIPAGQYAGDMLVWQQAGNWGLISAAGQPAAVGNILTVQSTGASTKLAWQAPPPPQPTTYYVNGTQIQTSFGLNIVAGNNTTVAGALDGSGTKVNITVTAGGPTSGLADPTTTKGDLIARSSSQVTRLPIGTDGTVLMADSTQTLGMKWATVSGGGGGGAQTPWTSNIDAAGYTLSNIPVIQAPASNNNLILNAPGASGSISLQAGGTTMATINQSVGLTAWGSIIANVNSTNNNPPVLTLAGLGAAKWNITGTSSPTTPGTNLLTFQCLDETAGIYVMNDLGYFGVGVAAPAHAIDAAGDVNCTGLYRIGGTQLAAAQVVNAVSTLGSYADPPWITSLAWSKITGAPSVSSYQTPWTSNINAATFNLSNVGTASSVAIDANGCGIFRGVGNPASGKFVRVGFDTGTAEGDILAYDITAGAYMPLQIRGSPMFMMAGNVGIGTTSPLQPLHAVNSTNSPVALFQNTGGGTASIELRDSATTPNRWWVACGITTPTDGALGFYDARQGVTQMIITPAGNVGIGTTAPDRKLTVKDTSGAAQVKILGSATGMSLLSYAAGNNQITMGAEFNGSAWVALDTTAVAILHSGPSGLMINTATGMTVGGTVPWSSAMTINYQGLVGIGTNSPASLLTIIPSANPTTPATAKQLAIGEQSNNPAYRLLLGYYLESSNSSYQGVIQCINNNAGSSLLLNPSGGNVGIGTNIPQSKLHIGNAASNSGAPTYRGTVILDEYNATLNATMGIEFATRGDSGGTGWRLSSLANNTDFIFESRGGSATWTERMRIMNGGNVGIGTTTPGANLELSDTLASDTAGSAQRIRFSFGGTGLYGFRNGGSNNYLALDVYWSSWVQSMCWNRSNGFVGIGTNAPRSVLSIMAGTPATPSTATQLTICEGTNNGGYGLAIGYGQNSPTGWAGVLQATAGGNPYPLLLNPGGGVVGIGKAGPSYNLDVAGDCNITGTYRVNGAPYVGQWQFSTANNVTGSRGFQAWYTNSTGRPMFVNITVSLNSQSATAAVYLGTSTTSYTQVAGVYSSWTYIGQTQFTMSFFVPNAWVYSLNYGGNVGITMWFEWT